MQLDSSEVVRPTGPDFKFQKHFIHSFTIESQFQIIKFSLCALSRSGLILEVATGQCTLKDLAKGFSTIWLSLPVNNAAAQAFVYCDELLSCEETMILVLRTKAVTKYALGENDDDIVQLKFSARKLDKKDLLGSSDPYFALILSESGLKLHQSEVIKKTLKPSWNKFQVPRSMLSSRKGEKVYVNQNKLLITFIR